MGRFGITVAIPVGPYPANQRWLPSCLESIQQQTRQPDEVLLVCDMAGLPQGMNHQQSYPIRTWCSPWRLGVAHAFNFGVALAEFDLIFLMGSDDKLLPQCLEFCLRSYEKSQKPDETYFAVPIKYSDGREDQYAPCNAAMVSKALWKRCGGFPVESSSGAPDAALISIFMKHPEAGRFEIVDGNRPLYWYRVHEETDTAQRYSWQGVILSTRDILTQQWKAPIWNQ